MLATYNTDIDDATIDLLIERHVHEGRQMRGCVPRELCHRIADICRYRGIPFQINDELPGLAWVGYYGSTNGHEDEIC